METSARTDVVRQAICEAVLTKADGTVINYGVISYYHKTPLKRIALRLKLKLIKYYLSRSKK